MYCRGCNTRIDEGKRSCPNCGRTVKQSSLGAMSSSSGRDLGDSGGRSLGDSCGRGRSGAARDEIELSPGSARAAGASGAGVPPEPAVSAAGVTSLDPARLRDLVAANPDLLEPGLRPYANEKGKLIGVGYASGVGEIDLLALDAGAGLVVAMVAERGEKGSDLVSAMLSRIGWVKKHLARPTQEVRGIVLVESRPDDLGYAAAAVADTVVFKTYRMSILLEDVDL